MAVIDELIIIEDGESKSVDSASNKTIDVINVDGENYHFAKENEVNDGNCENAVEEPIIDLKLSGNSVQNGTPTPETPIEIESVGDKTKNLWEFDFKEFNRDSKGATYTFKKPITTNCTFFYRNNNYEADGNLYFMYFKKQDGGVYIYPNHIKKNNVITITGTEENPILQVQIRNGGNSYISGGSIDNFMLVEGTYSVDTMPNYEPYGYKVPVKVGGKNLFDISKITTSSITIEGNKMYLPINTSGNGYCGTNKKLSALCPSLNVGDVVTLSFKTNGSKEYIYLSGYGRSWPINKSMTITQEMLDSSVVFYGNDVSLGETEQTIISEIQIEKGNVATEYEPYIEPITTNIYLSNPLRKIGDYADYIDYKNKKVVRNVEVLDDSGTQTIENSYQGLATPTEETIDIPQIETFKGVNIFDTDTSIKASEIKINYWKQI